MRVVSCSRKQRERFILILLCAMLCLLFYKRMWYPLSATWSTPFVFGCNLTTGTRHFQFQRWVIFRSTAHHVIIVIVCLQVVLYCSIFFSDLADLLHFVHPGIYLISQTSLAYHFKMGKSFSLADRNHLWPSLAFFRSRLFFILWVFVLKTC